MLEEPTTKLWITFYPCNPKLSSRTKFDVMRPVASHFTGLLPDLISAGFDLWRTRQSQPVYRLRTATTNQPWHKAAAAARPAVAPEECPSVASPGGPVHGRERRMRRICRYWPRAAAANPPRPPAAAPPP